MAAAQLTSIPDGLTNARNAYEVNHLLISGNEQDKEWARKSLERIDIEAIKHYSIEKMLLYMQAAAAERCDLIVFPELALTSFFPYFYIASSQMLLRFFETEPVELGLAKPLFDYARATGMGLAFGFAEYVPEEEGSSEPKRYNTYVLYDKRGNLYTYRKTHIPGFTEPQPGMASFQFEQGQFHSSQSGYPVFQAYLLGECEDCTSVRIGMLICHDRRYNAPYLIMGMQQVEVIINGYNTPFHLPFADVLDKHVYEFHYLPLQAQAITEGTFILAVARAGKVFGVDQIAGTCIIDPYGNILTKTEVLSKELLFAELSLDTCQIVRAQTYGGSRRSPHVLLKELEKLLGDTVQEAIVHSKQP